MKVVNQPVMKKDAMSLVTGKPVFLDDVTVDDVQNALQIKVSIVESSGNDFVNCILNE